MSKKEENTSFVCIVCTRTVPPLLHGGYRNHCPFCLSSLHVDDLKPGDRKSSCLGIMQPHRLHFKGKKGWQIIHKCTQCGIEKPNKIAVDESVSDDWMEIIRLSLKN